MRRRRHLFTCTVFVLVFIAYALNYAYFFVDDEAIPFVYAQNVLDGHGLAYNPDDGPVEGYSDFLSVWIDVAILRIVTSIGATKLWALGLAELFAFACAITLVIVSFAILSRHSGAGRVPVVAGMAFLALAGPLAVWSSSALETTLFALIIAVLAGALLEVTRSNPRNDYLILVSVIAAQLCRIDGIVWAGALLAPFLILAPRPRRRELITRVLVPSLAVFIAYHGWRFWYFGELLPMPLYAKVMYKLRGGEALISNDPPERYVIAFFRAYHWIPIAVLLCGFVRTQSIAREMGALATAITLVLGYLWIVGDWMFGFRFIVPLLAPMAILVAAGFRDLSRWRPRIAATATVIWIAGLCVIAAQFWHTYERHERRVSWLAAPSFDPARLFAPYYQIYLQARPYTSPGETIAYNQAGFVPFMLAAHNIDDLGICTKFYAKLPTSDIVFTEVGRYSPLTARPVLRASEVYTLSRAPRLLLANTGNLRYANRGAVPDTVLAGAYRLQFSLPSIAGYAPAHRLDPIHDSRLFLENLVHVSHLRRVGIDNRVLTVSEYRSALPYLYGRRSRLTFKGRYDADFTFSDVDEDVHQVYIGSIRSERGPTSVAVMLLNTARREVYRDSFELMAHEERDFRVSLGQNMKAAVLLLSVASPKSGSQVVSIEDVRVQGQTGVLKRFLGQYHELD